MHLALWPGQPGVGTDSGVELGRADTPGHQNSGKLVPSFRNRAGLADFQLTSASSLLSRTRHTFVRSQGHGVKCENASRFRPAEVAGAPGLRDLPTSL